jgi:MFS family permease
MKETLNKYLEKRTKKSMSNAVYEGTASSTSSSIVDSYTVPFLMSVGASNFQIGILSSMKNFASMCSQVPGSMLVERFNRKNIFIFSVIVSQLLWLFIIFTAFFFTQNIIVPILVLISGSVFFQTIRNPSWTSLLGDITPQDQRGRYFSKRNAIMGAAGLISTLVAGFLLSTYGFLVIFMISVFAGLCTIVFFIRIHEPYIKKPYFYKKIYAFDAKEYVRFLKADKNFSFFTLYSSFSNFAVDFVVPFIAVYIIRDIGASYELFALSIALGALSRILSQKYWGILADRFGNRRIMYISGFIMCFVPFFYAFSSNIYHIIAIKIYDGFVWAGLDLVKFNYLLSITPSDKRPKYVANYNILTILGSVIGAAVGGIFVIFVENTTLMIFYGLQIMFLVSFLLRLGSTFMLKFVKDIEKYYEDVPVRYIMMHPISTGLEKGMNFVTSFTTRYPYSLGEMKERLKDEYKKRKYLAKLGKRSKDFYEPESPIK